MKLQFILILDGVEEDITDKVTQKYGEMGAMEMIELGNDLLKHPGNDRVTAIVVRRGEHERRIFRGSLMPRIFDDQIEEFLDGLAEQYKLAPPTGE